MTIGAPLRPADQGYGPPTTRAAEGLPRRAFTLAEFERMAEVGGEVVPMAPKGARNESIRAGVGMLWGKACSDGFMVAPVTALRLDNRHYFEPDFIVFSRDKRLADLKGLDLLLVVEVADFSLAYDLSRKPFIYAAFGVRELWVVDAVDDTVYVHREPGPKGYGKIRRHPSGHRLMPRFAPASLGFALSDLPSA